MTVPGEVLGNGATSSTVESAGAGSSATSVGAPTSGRGSARRAWTCSAASARTPTPTRRRTHSRARSGARVEAPLEADRGRGLGAHRLAAERAGDMAGEDLHAVRQLEQPPQRTEEALGALLRRRRGRAGPRRRRRGVAVSTSHGSSARERSITSTQVCSGRWPGVRSRADDLAELELVSVGERLVLVRRLGRRVDRDRDAVLEREPAVAGEVVGVRVRLDRPHDPTLPAASPRAPARSRTEDRRPRRHLLPRRRPERRTAEVVVNELLEEHEP